MADLYSVISGLEVDQQDVLEAELFAKQLIEAQFPDLDLREGTGIRDVVLRPSAFILALCKKGVDSYFAQRSISGVTDTTDQSIVDDLMANVFLTRNTGSYAMINVRLYFARQKTVSLSSSTSFSTDGSLIFYPPVSISYPESAMQFDSFSNEWFIDVDLVAANKGSDYNLSSGSLLYFSNFDPYFLHGEINYLSSQSTDAETNTEFITRASTAVSTRNLINLPSIQSSIGQNFNYMNRLAIVGAGNEEMHRDQVISPGFIGSQLIATSASLSSGVFTLDIVAHGLILNQTVNLVEINPAPGLYPYVVKGGVITTVVSPNQIQVTAPFTIPDKALGQMSVYPVDNDLYVHVGGCVDIYCGDTIVSEPQTLTVSSQNTVTLYGPIMEVVPAPDAGDTATNSNFTVSYPGHKIVGNITVTYDATDGSLIINSINHGMTKSRFVLLGQYPTSTSSQYLPITEVIDEDNFKLGSGLSSFAVTSGIPYLRVVDPSLDTGASENQKIVLTMTTPQAGRTFTVNLYSWDKVANLQSYMDAPTNAVICAQYLARGYNIYWLTISADAYEQTGSEAQASAAVTAYLSSLGPGDAFITADMVSKIYEAGVTALTLPLTVTFQLFTRDLQSPGGTTLGYPGTITDRLLPFSTNSVFILKSFSLTVNNV